MRILNNKSSVHSKNGEDGIISLIFSKLNISKGLFIDVGASDGIQFSNTYSLFSKGWEGIYIESNRKKFQDLHNNFKKFNNKVNLINQEVGFDIQNSLDKIIDSTKFKNKIFDFMSLDVDGLEYNIFKALNKYLPTVICINVNPGHSPLFNREIPPEIAKNNIGQSMNIVFKEAKKKGYFPLCFTGNLFLIKKIHLNHFSCYQKSLTQMYTEYLENLPTSELKYLYYYFIIKRDFKDKGIEDDGIIFSNPELWNFCGDLAMKNKEKYSNQNNTQLNNDTKINSYKPTYELNEKIHNVQITSDKSNNIPITHIDYKISNESESNHYIENESNENIQSKSIDNKDFNSIIEDLRKDIENIQEKFKNLQCN